MNRVPEFIDGINHLPCGGKLVIFDVSLMSIRICLKIWVNLAVRRRNNALLWSGKQRLLRDSDKQVYTCDPGNLTVALERCKVEGQTAPLRAFRQAIRRTRS